MAISHMRASEAGFLANPILFEDAECDCDGAPQQNPLGESVLVLCLLAAAGVGGYYWWTTRAVTGNMVSGQSLTVTVPVGHTLIVNAPPGSWQISAASQTSTSPPLTLSATSATSSTYKAAVAGSAIITATSSDGTQTATLNIVVS